MSRITISQDKTHFEKDGKPFFIMADTCWSAFTNMTMQEWDSYLKRRSELGFTVIQISLLPQWDRGLAEGETICPFVKEGEDLHLSDIPESYWEHVAEYLAKLREYPLEPALVLLWSNYTKGTFFDSLLGRVAMAEEDVTAYVRKAVKVCKPYEPIYFVGGDTGFTDQVVDSYYLPALITAKEEDPEALATVHICGDGFETVEQIEEVYPKRLLYNDLLDFYIYQSGHYAGWLERCALCGEAFTKLKIRKPVFNSEPCYEGWDTAEGYHGREDVRSSTWFSILSGAAAGLSYGAQGIWQWYRPGDRFIPYDLKHTDTPLLYRCEKPFEAEDAMQFEGAKDRIFAREILEKYEITSVCADGRFEAETSHTKLAVANDGKILMLYVPHRQRTIVHIPLEGRKFALYDLDRRITIAADITETEDGFALEHTKVNSDCLLIVY